jgi:hypothetical protein
VSANCAIDTNYYLYEMSTQETDALQIQIYKKYKTTWEQARLTASAFGGEGINFPWDEENEEIDNVPESSTTQEDLQEAYKRYLQTHH